MKNKMVELNFVSIAAVFGGNQKHCHYTYTGNNPDSIKNMQVKDVGYCSISGDYIISDASFNCKCSEDYPVGMLIYKNKQGEVTFQKEIH